MLVGSYEELEACIHVLLQLRANAAVDVGAGKEAALARLLALDSLIEQYERYAAFARHFVDGRHHRTPDF